MNALMDEVSVPTVDPGVAVAVKHLNSERIEVIIAARTVEIPRPVPCITSASVPPTIDVEASDPIIWWSYDTSHLATEEASVLRLVACEVWANVTYLGSTVDECPLHKCATAFWDVKEL